MQHSIKPAAPFADVRSPHLGPFPSRPFPWWLLPVTIGMLGALALLWRISEPPAVTPAAAEPAAPVLNLDLAPVNTAIALALATETPTPTPEPTLTPTPMVSFIDQYGYCRADSAPGTVCVPNQPDVTTPTAVPTCFPGTFALLCRVPGDPDLTSADNTTE